MFVSPLSPMWTMCVDPGVRAHANRAPRGASRHLPGRPERARTSAAGKARVAAQESARCILQCLEQIAQGHAPASVCSGRVAAKARSMRTASSTRLRLSSPRSCSRALSSVTGRIHAAPGCNSARNCRVSANTAPGVRPPSGISMMRRSACHLSFYSTNRAHLSGTFGATARTIAQPVGGDDCMRLRFGAAAGSSDPTWTCVPPKSWRVSRSWGACRSLPSRACPAWPSHSSRTS